MSATIPVTHQAYGAKGSHQLTVKDALKRSEWYLRYALDHPDGQDRGAAFHAHGKAALTQHTALGNALAMEAG